ncbi:nitrile hydratase subunit beta [Rhodobacteraceae bacterium]|nr:nitrile hydratase subunit beta [Paracoccaceae bacterium]
MDGPQDLGGKESFGPIEVNSPDYRHDWERRQWALTKLVATPGVTIDWFRHALETMPPAVYLSVPYFQKWNANNMALAIDTGDYTLEECVTGKAIQPGTPAPVLTVDDCETLQRSLHTDFSRAINVAPAFHFGDHVQTDARPTPGHSRLPSYASGAKGQIIAHHGAHVFADAGAKGDHSAHHLYTVEFRASDLWADAECPDDTVCLDLWEPYLASA